MSANPSSAVSFVRHEITAAAAGGGGARVASDLYRRLNGVLCLYKPPGYTLGQCLHSFRLKLANELNLVASEDHVNDCASGAGGVRLCDGVLKRLDSLSSASTKKPRRTPPRLPAHLARSTQLPATAVTKTAPVKVDPSVLHERRAALSMWKNLVRSSRSNNSISHTQAAVTSQARVSQLIYGDLFQPQDVHIRLLQPLGPYTSGVLPVALNGGRRLLDAVCERQLRVYRLTCRLGFATDTLYADGRVTDRATHAHVTRARVEAVLVSLQAAHQRHAFEHAGVPVNSHEAYELASRGMPRPVDASAPPIIYCLRCVGYSPPFFTLEVHAINEDEQYLLTLVNELGRQLRSAATVMHVRCVRHGAFTAEMALLWQHWSLPAVCQALRRSVPLLARQLWRSDDAGGQSDALLATPPDTGADDCENQQEEYEGEQEEVMTEEESSEGEGWCDAY